LEAVVALEAAAAALEAAAAAEAAEAATSSDRVFSRPSRAVAVACEYSKKPTEAKGPLMDMSIHLRRSKRTGPP
jgi:hypothetical protein